MLEDEEVAGAEAIAVVDAEDACRASSSWRGKGVACAAAASSSTAVDAAVKLRMARLVYNTESRWWRVGSRGRVYLGSN